MQIGSSRAELGKYVHERGTNSFGVWLVHYTVGSRLGISFQSNLMLAEACHGTYFVH